VKPSHFLLSDVISKCTTFSQPFLPPSDPPANAPWFFLRYRRYINHLLTYLLWQVNIGIDLIDIFLSLHIFPVQFMKESFIDYVKCPTMSVLASEHFCNRGSQVASVQCAVVDWLHTPADVHSVQHSHTVTSAVYLVYRWRYWRESKPERLDWAGSWTTLWSDPCKIHHD